MTKEQARKHTLRAMKKDEGDLTLIEDYYIEQVIDMLAEIDMRLIQYPLLSVDFIHSSILYQTVDHKQLNIMLNNLRLMDALKGK